MQKLGSENINTPYGAPQAVCNCDLQLNRDKTLYPKSKLSVAGKKTFSNNIEVDRPVFGEFRDRPEKLSVGKILQLFF
jgi:hypothetical protein